MEITTQLRTTEPTIPEKSSREPVRSASAESQKLSEGGSSFAEQLVRKARSPGDDGEKGRSVDKGESGDKGQEEATAMALASTSTANKEELKPRINELSEVVGKAKAVGEEPNGPAPDAGEPDGPGAPKAFRDSAPPETAGQHLLKDDAGTAVHAAASVDENQTMKAPKSDPKTAEKAAASQSAPTQAAQKVTADDAVPGTSAAADGTARGTAEGTAEAAARATETDTETAKLPSQTKEKSGVSAVRSGTAAADAVQPATVRRTRQEKLRDEPVVREITVDLRRDADGAAPEPVSRTEAVTLPATVREPTAPAATQVPLDNLARRLNGDLGDTIVRHARVIVSEGDKAEIRLIIRPPELGRVRIQLQMEQGHIAGRILVDNANVRQVIEQNLGALQRAFAEAGLEMGQLDVQTGDSRENGQKADQNRDHYARHPGAGEFDQNVRTVAEYDYGNRHINLVA